MFVCALRSLALIDEAHRLDVPVRSMATFVASPRLDAPVEMPRELSTLTER